MAILKPKICDSFSGKSGDTVQWQNVPAAGCRIEAGTTAWPFSPGPPIPNVLTAGTITIVVNPPASTSYNFDVKCCAGQVLKTVQVG
jgi:hypothetical protein